MARTPKENRNEVASAIVNLRVTEPEREALEALMRNQQAKLAELGVVAPVSQATVIRSLIQKEARTVFGAFPIHQTELPLPAPKEPAPSQEPIKQAEPIAKAPEPPSPPPVQEILAKIRSMADPKTGLVHVPSLVSELGGDADMLKAELVKLDADGRIELRPESGVGLLSPEDAALCPKGVNGEALSMVREKMPEPPKEKSPVVPDKEKLRARLKKAAESKKLSPDGKPLSVYFFAKETDIDRGLLNKFKLGERSLSDVNAMKLAAALERVGA